MKRFHVDQPHPFFDLCQDLRNAVPALVLGFALICKLVLDSQYRYAIDITLLLFALFPVAILKLYAKLYRGYRKVGFDRYIPLFALLGITSAITIAVSITSPAHALFFNDAEQWSKTAFQNGTGQDVQSAITFVFNLFRFIMVAAILGTVAAVGFALATDRDVSTIARVPAGFAAIFVIGDIFSSLLTKGAGAGTPTP